MIIFETSQFSLYLGDVIKPQKGPETSEGGGYRMVSKAFLDPLIIYDKFQ